jgi:hypothetical protein
MTQVITTFFILKLVYFYSLVVSLVFDELVTFSLWKNCYCACLPHTTLSTFISNNSIYSLILILLLFLFLFFLKCQFFNSNLDLRLHI